MRENEMTHPTPAEISVAVMRALKDADGLDDPNILPIPVRVYGIVDRAILEAFNRCGH